MARAIGAPGYHGSLLDRLVEPSSRRDATPTLAQLRDGLRRDCENLLNTRRRFIGWPAEFEELERSLLAYGLGDFTHEALGSPVFRQEFGEQVTLVLQRLEPRIAVQEVRLLDNTDALDRRLRFRITGEVRFGEERHGVSFDSFIDPVECEIVIRDQ